MSRSEQLRRFAAGAAAVLALTGGAFAVTGCGGDDGNDVRDVDGDESESGSGSGSGSESGSESDE